MSYAIRTLSALIYRLVDALHERRDFLVVMVCVAAYLIGGVLP